MGENVHAEYYVEAIGDVWQEGCCHLVKGTVKNIDFVLSVFVRVRQGYGRLVRRPNECQPDSAGSRQ